jgi:molecular chaperone DnaK (HSP70)
LINDVAAASLQYCLFRKKDLDDKTPRYVMIVDIGACKTSISIVSFTKNEFKVI